jgi:protease-4
MDQWFFQATDFRFFLLLFFHGRDTVDADAGQRAAFCHPIPPSPTPHLHPPGKPIMLAEEFLPDENRAVCQEAGAGRKEKGAAMEYIKTMWLSHPRASYVLWLGLPLIAGILLAMLVPRPAVGVVYLRDAIYSDSAGDAISQFRYAYDQPGIQAVVLVLDSPGGTVADTESLYLELIRLRKRKPVVAVIESMAASGAYYLAVGADFIIAKPSSQVGNIGVRTVLPSSPSVFEDEVSTGPYKFYGGSRDETLRLLDPLKQGFLQAVLLGRGPALYTTKDNLISGKLFIGSEALRYGLIDALGTQSEAIDKAANLAHIWNFETKDLRPLALGSASDAPYSLFFIEAEDGSQSAYPRKPGVYYLYIPESDRRLP